MECLCLFSETCQLSAAMVHVTFTFLCNIDFYPIVFYFRIPAAGFYNKDDIPDLLVRYNTGIGFPVYFYSNVSWSASVKKIIIITFFFSIILKPLLPTITSLHLFSDIFQPVSSFGNNTLGESFHYPIHPWRAAK